MDDPFFIPEFLRRESTPEVLARIKRTTARYRERRIKNPPKRVPRKMRTGLGGGFGLKVKES